MYHPMICAEHSPNPSYVGAVLLIWSPAGVGRAMPHGIWDCRGSSSGEHGQEVGVPRCTRRGDGLPCYASTVVPGNILLVLAIADCWQR